MKAFVHALGCRLNQYEAQFLRENLEGLPGEGEVHVVNTCTVTSLADRKARQLVGRLRRENPGALVVAVGCGADGAGEGLRRAGADLVVGNRDKARLRGILEAHLSRVERPSEGWPTLAGERVRGPGERTRALLKVQDGCTVGCIFCRAWQVRGPLRSKPVAAARSEAEALARAGHREVVLVGLNLAQYGRDLPGRPSLVDLLRGLLPVEGVRFRLSSLNPEAVTDSLLDLFAREPRLCPHLHMPLQSGDDEVLRRMGRPYRVAQYTERARAFLAAVPKATLGTDAMVGFPGEDEAAFRKTVEVLAALEPLNVHIFRFSPRPGTAAARASPRVAPAVAARRARDLSELARGWARAVRRRLVGTLAEVVVEDLEEEGFWGHSENYLWVRVEKGNPQRGTIVPVRLIEAGEDHMMGVIVNRAENE